MNTKNVCLHVFMNFQKWTIQYNRNKETTQRCHGQSILFWILLAIPNSQLLRVLPKAGSVCHVQHHIKSYNSSHDHNSSAWLRQSALFWASLTDASRSDGILLKTGILSGCSSSQIVWYWSFRNNETSRFRGSGHIHMSAQALALIETATYYSQSFQGLG